MQIELDLSKDYTDEQVALMHKIVARHYGKIRKEENKDTTCVAMGITIYHRDMLDAISKALLMSRQDTINEIVYEWFEKHYGSFEALKQKHINDGSLDWYLKNTRSINARNIANTRYSRVASGGPSKVKSKLHTLSIRPIIKEYLQHVAIEIEKPITDVMAGIIEEKYKDLFK